MLVEKRHVAQRTNKMCGMDSVAGAKEKQKPGRGWETLGKVVDHTDQTAQRAGQVQDT